MLKRILIVDRSALIRRYIVSLLQENGYEVVSVQNEQQAIELLEKEHFSLVLLDFDGKLEIIQKIMECCPTRIVIMSCFDPKEDANVFSALECGVIDYIQKPNSSVDIVKIASTILEKIKNALLIPRTKLQKKGLAFKVHNTNIDSSIEMGFVLVGSSTGGPRLIEKICKTLPKNYPHAVCVVQHMPVDFTVNFAKRLNSISEVEVIEADNGIELQAGRVIIAKGGWHLHFKRKLKSFEVKLAPNTQDRFFVPSVDEMFFSAATVLPPKKILAVELTGIGDDGADGMVELRKMGAYTIAESEASAVVYGMPKEAYERGGAMKVLDFNDILDEIIKYGQKH